MVVQYCPLGQSTVIENNKRYMHSGCRYGGCQLSDTTVSTFNRLRPRIHLVHLQISKYFMDDSSVNFHDKFFLHFLLKFRKKWRKNLSWKFMEELSVSVKYVWIHKWTWWIRPKYRKYLDEKADMCPNSMLSHNFFYVIWWPLSKSLLCCRSDTLNKIG